MQEKDWFCRESKMPKVPVTMPHLSDTMETGKISSWTKKPGNRVKAGEVIGEIETDKALVEIESPAEGVFLSPREAGESDVPVGETIAWIDTSGVEEVPLPAHDERPVTSGSIGTTGVAFQSMKADETFPPPALKADTLIPATIQGTDPDVRMTPYAKALANDLGVPTGSLFPKGGHQVITAKDVLRMALKQSVDPDLTLGPPFRIEKNSSIRESVARNMVNALQIPSFRISSDIELSLFIDVVKKAGISITLGLSRILAVSVMDHPRMNASWISGGMALRDQVDVGIAVDTGEGLVTPVLRNTAKRDIRDLQAEWEILLEKARKQKLLPREYLGGTIYLSNLGNFRCVSYFDAVIPVGASAILAVAAPRSNGFSSLTLTCDHRVVFGADAARFLETFSANLKNSALFPGRMKDKAGIEK